MDLLMLAQDSMASRVVDIIDDHFFWVLIASAFLVGALIKAFTSVIRGFQREKSRREIAAYIAEGSMTPEQGEKLLNAQIGPKDPDLC